MVAKALRRLSTRSVPYVTEGKKEIAKDMHRLALLVVHL